MNFVRTISGAFATSLVTTAWEDKAKYAHAELSGIVDPAGDFARGMTAVGPHSEVGRALLDGQVTGQSLLLSTNGVMMVLSAIFVVASILIVLAPKPSRAVSATAATH